MVGDNFEGSPDKRMLGAVTNDDCVYWFTSKHNQILKFHQLMMQ